MKQNKIFLKDWIKIHPYTSLQESDIYFTELANRLYSKIIMNELPDIFRKKICIYTAAYLEDLISNLGLWKSFRKEHFRLYKKLLPFYITGKTYDNDEPNKEDICFIIWNTWQKVSTGHKYIDPENPIIEKQADELIGIINEAYEEAPENGILDNYFQSPENEKEAEKKLNWLFGHTYLTEPSMYPYIERVAPNDKFIMPTGPLALFLFEWITLLSDNNDWKKIKGLFHTEQHIPDSVKEKNKDIYNRFTSYTGGNNIVYINGYESLKSFLINALEWPDDDNHTLPQMKEFTNFILMCNPEKGMLLAKNICEYIDDEKNPMYDKEKATNNAFRLLTEETLCPPDLLVHCINNNLIHDAVIPGSDNTEIVIQNADFIARHSLLYYYRGD